MNWLELGQLGFQLAMLIVPQIHAVQTMTQNGVTMDSSIKENMAVALVKTALETGDLVAGKQLAADSGVEAAVRSFIQGYVSIQNALAAAKTAKKPQ